ncbi:MAG: hypothetical protein H6Q66_2145 [Firmicutes bacterium]|nr:hypothetical protein [Bacillota bacterium]
MSLKCRLDRLEKIMDREGSSVGIIGDAHGLTKCTERRPSCPPYPCDYDPTSCWWRLAYPKGEVITIGDPSTYK